MNKNSIAGNARLRLIGYSLFGGLMFSAMTCFGYSLNTTDTIWHSWTFRALFALWPVFAVCTGLGLWLLSRSGEKSTAADESATDITQITDEKGKNRRRYLIYWGFLFLCWVPTLLASYPGIFSYDCGWQLVSWVDGDLSAHHPILHTALLGICRSIGQAINGSNQTGALIYSLTQMTLLSAMYAYVCVFLRSRAPRWLTVVSLLFFGLHPTNSLMALCATKDTLFTGVFAVLMVQLFKIIEDRDAFFASRRRQAAFVINVFLMFALRNNGFHTFVICVPFLLIAFRKYWKKTAVICAVCICLYAAYTGPVYNALGVEGTEIRESMCVVMQSAARAWNLDYLGLTEEQKEGLTSVISEEGLNAYMSRFADTVKAEFSDDAFEEDPWGFLKAWISVGMNHKKIYIDSFLANTFGYWYPGDSIQETDNGKDYFEYYCKEFREDVDVVMEPKITALSEFYRKIGNESSFQSIPVVSLTFNLGTYTWLWFFACLLILYRRQYGRLILLIPLGAYFFTTLLGPVVKLRYHYPFIVCAPLIIYLMWSKKGGMCYGQNSCSDSVLQ